MSNGFGAAALLTEARNYAVVQLPGRKFPGVVFQGDSLFALRVSLARLAQEPSEADLRAGARELRNEIDQVLAHYVAVVDSGGGSLPFDY